MIRSINNTPGTRGGPGGRDRTLAVERRKTPEREEKKNLHISFSYAKLLGDTNFQPREFPRSGSKAKDGEEERERDKD